MSAFSINEKGKEKTLVMVVKGTDTAIVDDGRGLDNLLPLSGRHCLYSVWNTKTDSINAVTAWRIIAVAAAVVVGFTKADILFVTANNIAAPHCNMENVTSLYFDSLLMKFLC